MLRGLPEGPRMSTPELAAAAAPQPVLVNEKPQDRRRWGRLRDFYDQLGPGLITGAADDDPSGISTYSVAGATFGYAPLWTALFSFPLMAAVQLMCARLGLVTGRGLAGVIRRTYPKWVLIGACALLVSANLVNIAADLAGMGEAAAMVTGVKAYLWTPLFAVFILSMLFWASYRSVARIFKWLTLFLFSYVVTAFVVHPNWWLILKATLVPHIELSSAYLSIFVGILGTTISPYLFFWQAAQEVEEERLHGHYTVRNRQKATSHHGLAHARNDVVIGMFFSNLVMFFIILTTGATLHAAGITQIDTAQQAAEALRPMAGKAAYLLFTMGLIGTGVLGVPVLAGSCAYAIAEAAGWKASLQYKPARARAFYSVIAVSMLLGLALNYVHLSAVTMLFCSAVVNGVLAPPLVILVLLLTNNPKVMGEHVNSPLMKWLGWTCAAAMTLAAIGMFVTSGSPQ
jgi:NRAMP (natural resistance-associated macrophage protein)-like metal ion transporter